MSGNYSSRFWDDLRFPATGVNPAGPVNAPDVEADTGLLLFDDVTVETAFVLAQMPHTWDEGTTIHPHVHWSKTTSAAGDVLWQVRYRWWNVGATWSAWSDYTSLTESVPTGDVADTSGIAGGFDLDQPTALISAMFLFQIQRTATDGGDTYAADARLEEFDIHYRKDQAGSRSIFTKD